MREINILIACEESQTVCKEFRKLGFNAFSCDIIECSGGHDEWHIQQDVLPLLDGNCYFITCGGEEHYIDRWDLIVAHPPCTFLCMSGQQWCNIEKYGENAIKRLKEQEKALEFVKKIYNCSCKHIAIENPVGVLTRRFMRPTQYIRPCEFGHHTGKRTGLWLKNLPLLKPTNNVEIQYHTSKTGKKWDLWFWQSSMIRDLKERSKFRSKTFEGIANAMANQWGEYIFKEVLEEMKRGV